MARHRGHNAGSITEIKKDGKVVAYRPQLSLPGGGRKSLPRVTTKKEAQRLIDEAKAAALQGRLTAGRSQTLAEYLSGWLETKKGAVKPLTYKRYESYVRVHIVPHLGKVRLDALRPAHVQDWLNTLSAKKLNPQTVRHAHAVLHNALEDSLGLDLLGRNVSEGLERPRLRQQDQPWYTVEQLDALLQTTTGDRFHALWVVLGTTGLRLGEALALRWSYVDLVAGSLRVEKTLQRQQAGGGLVFEDPKSRQSRRSVDLSEEARGALLAHRERQAFERKKAMEEWQDQDLVFTSEIGTPLEQGRVHKHWVKAVAKAGIPRYRIHDLRHTVASQLMAAGMNPVEISRVLGHSSPALVLQRYGHAAPSTPRKAADLIDALLARGRTAL